MKKVLALVMGSMLLLSGCGSRVGQEVKREINEEVNDVKEDFKEATQPITQNADKENFIGEEKAKEIALSKAEITADEVIFDRVELEADDGIWQYDVEFRKDRTEYSAEINASDGSVISWEVDND